MAEWSKAHDWKSCVPLKGTVSSNLTLSANKKATPEAVLFFLLLVIGRDLGSREVSSTRTIKRTGVRRSAKPISDEATRVKRE